MNYQVFEKLYFAKSYYRLTKEINNMYVPLLQYQTKGINLKRLVKGSIWL